MDPSYFSDSHFSARRYFLPYRVQSRAFIPLLIPMSLCLIIILKQPISFQSKTFKNIFWLLFSWPSLIKWRPPCHRVEKRFSCSHTCRNILNRARYTFSQLFSSMCLFLFSTLPTFLFWTLQKISTFFSQLCPVSGVMTSSWNTCRRSQAEHSALPPGDDRWSQNSDETELQLWWMMMTMTFADLERLWNCRAMQPMRTSLSESGWRWDL